MTFYNFTCISVTFQQRRAKYDAILRRYSDAYASIWKYLQPFMR